MSCTSCGSTLSSDQMVCPSCGAAVSVEKRIPTHNNSGTVTSSNIEFGPIRETVSTPPITIYPYQEPMVLGSELFQETMPQDYSIPPQIHITGQPQTQNVLQQPNYFPAQSPIKVHQAIHKQSNRVPVAMMAILIILLVLLIIGSSGLGYYLVVKRPAEFQAQATAVTQKLLATQAQSTAQANALATATTSAMTTDAIYIKATAGTPVINDPLDNKQGSSWIQTIPPQNICTFYGGAYHILVPADKGSGICLAYGSLFSDLAFQVQLTFLQGDTAGLIFRTGNRSPGSYFFQISRWGDYAFGSFQGNDTTILASGNSHVINQGFYMHNLLTAVALGNHMYLYVNRQLVASVTNSNYSSGQIALFASSNTGSSDVAFNNAQVWAL